MGSPAGKETLKHLFGGGDTKMQNIRGATNGDSSSSQTSSSSPSSQESNPTLEREARHVPDAIHPRFRSREDLLFRCRSCGKTSASERKIQKHFLKNCTVLLEIPKYSCPLPECEGPTFSYEFKQCIKLFHSCKDWAKFMKSSRSSSYNFNNTPASSLSASSSFAGTSTNQSSSFASLNGTSTSNTVPSTPSSMSTSFTGPSSNESSSSLTGTNFSNVSSTPSSMSTSSLLVNTSTNESSSSFFSVNVPNFLPTESQTESFNNVNSLQPMEVIESYENGQSYDIH